MLGNSMPFMPLKLPHKRGMTGSLFPNADQVAGAAGTSMDIWRAGMRSCTRMP